MTFVDRMLQERDRNRRGKQAAQKRVLNAGAGWQAERGGELGKGNGEKVRRAALPGIG